MAELQKYFRGLKRDDKEIRSRHARTSLCIINDNDFIREGLLSLLNYIPGIAERCGFALNNFANLPANADFGIIITEIEFGNKIDLELIRFLRTTHPGSKIIVYTNFKNSHFRTHAMHAGADFYLFMEDKYNLLEHLIKGLLNQSVSNKRP